MSDPFDLASPLPPPTPAPSGPPAYLQSLNENQLQAVETPDGPVLVLAGAGTGKTRVLTTRLAHLMNRGLAGPHEVLAVTFTNKAAREMRERVAALVGRPVEGWWVGTFHALGARMLRGHAEAVGLRPNFTILDADDQQRLIKQHLEAEGIDEKQHPARTVLGVIQRWKDRGLLPDKVTEGEGADGGEGVYLTIYRQYQQRLTTLNAADFGDLLLLCLKLFQSRPEILARYQKQFRYILVDEYQDTNVAQYLWLRFLAQAHRNICCVGDDDQSIYSWRGAEVGNILRFEQDFKGACVVRLERNYRSTPHILAAASALITYNQGRLGKTLWTDINGGEKVVVRGVWDGEEEARATGDDIEIRHAGGQRLDQIAVLVRAGFQTREFEERLITLGIPYRVVGGARFYERQEIRDAIAYLRVIAQPDDDLAFERIVNVPKRGLGKATLQIVHQVARAGGQSLYRAAQRLCETDEIKPKARATLASVIIDFERWRADAHIIDHVDLAGQVLEESGYIDMWRHDKTPEAPGRLDNLKELVIALEQFGNLSEFLEHVSLVMENEEARSDEKVSLMTLHAAKGLEFDIVFLPGWEEGLFPHQRAMDEGGVAALEEERRLAYVGLTRARKLAVVSFAANRRIYGQWQSAVPSRFIDELPGDHVDRQSQPGLYGGNGFAGDGRGLSDPARSFGAPHFRRRLREPEWAVAQPLGGGAPLDVGQRVFHQKFGYGRIVVIDGDKLEIEFEKAGPKKVMDSFVEPA